MSDPEMIDALERDMKENGPMKLEEMRPPLLGFDPIVSGLHTLANQIISLRMDQGNAKVKHLPIPLFPAEIVEIRQRDFAARKRADVIAKSQAKWMEATGA